MLTERFSIGPTESEGLVEHSRVWHTDNLTWSLYSDDLLSVAMPC